MKYSVFAFLSIMFAMAMTGCDTSSSSGTSAPSAGTGDFSGFELTAINGSKMQHAAKYDANNLADEEGYVLNGKKEGSWLTYFPTKTTDKVGERRIKTLENYVNGQIEGVALEFDQRGQIIKKIYYHNGNYHGFNVTYKFGRPQEIIPYRDGRIHGKVIKYYSNGKVREEIGYKDGLQHGTYSHYNEEQKLDMQYEYKDGEKVSGGMVK